MKLYNVAYSGNSYKVHLLLAQLGIACEIVEVDILKGESRTPEFLRINPNGRTPGMTTDSCSPNPMQSWLISRGARNFYRKTGNVGLKCFSGYSSNNIATNPTSPPRAFGYSTNLIRPNATRF